MLVAGIATAPTLITSMALAQRLVPVAMLNEGMTVVLTGLVVGVSAGSAISGVAIEALGPTRAYVVPVLASSAPPRRARRPHGRSPAPSAAVQLTQPAPTDAPTTSYDVVPAAPADRITD